MANTPTPTGKTFQLWVEEVIMTNAALDLMPFDETRWREYFEELRLSEVFATEDVPDPRAYPTWRECADELVLATET